MKNKNLLILFVIYNFLFIASLRVNAQWDRTYQVTSIMQAVHFINNSTGWMVGVGDLYKTTNSGISWNAYLSPSGGFSDVEFLNDNTGFMVQGSSVVYKTTNSGINWTTTNINQGSFRCIASSNNILWIAGGSGRLYKSTNFGVNWIDQSLSIQFLITNIQFVNSTTGWFLNSNGEIYRTTNGGTNWDFQLVSQLNSIFFTDINYGWGVGASTYRNIIKTTNGGINWIDLVIDPDSSRLNYCIGSSENGIFKI